MRKSFYSKIILPAFNFKQVFLSFTWSIMDLWFSSWNEICHGDLFKSKMNYENNILLSVQNVGQVSHENLRKKT